MRRGTALRVDEGAVSAAIATILLFAGVLSIIAVMLTAITPIINEYEGALEAASMQDQMVALAEDAEQLAMHGLPGETRSMTLDGMGGDFSWDTSLGGMWLSATHQADASFRVDGLLDHDIDGRVRFPTHELASLCFSDLRLGYERDHRWRLPDVNGEVYAMRTDGDAGDLRAVDVDLNQSGASTSHMTASADDVVRWTLPLAGGSGEAWITSEAPMTVLLVRGGGGATVIPPVLAGADAKGTAWALPLPSGPVTAHLALDAAALVSWTSGSDIGLVATDADGGWSRSWNRATDERLTISTDQPGALLLVIGDAADTSGLAAGAAPWPSDEGSQLGATFTLPAAGGSVLLHNPSATDDAIVDVAGVFHGVTQGTGLRLDWSPATSVDQIISDEPILVHWLADAAGSAGWRPGSLVLEGAQDTGGQSGASHAILTPIDGGTWDAPATGSPDVLIQPASEAATWTAGGTITGTGSLDRSEASARVTATSAGTATVVAGATDSPLRVWTVAGTQGATAVPHEGADRCIALSGQASGWVAVTLPWRDMGASTDATTSNQQRLGHHPDGIQLRLRGTVGDEPFGRLGSAWAIHLPRLSYTFDSSIVGLEVATRAGFVGTNHPEFQADALRLPSERVGEGGTWGATVPLLVPADGAAQGGGDFQMDLTLAGRVLLASEDVESLRRGWDGPYASAIAAELSRDVAYSQDWYLYPGQPDLIDDVTGWVPDPATGDTSEVILLNGPTHDTRMELAIGIIVVDAVTEVV